MRNRKRWLTFGVVITGLLVVAAGLWTVRDHLLEPWYLKKLAAGTPDERTYAAGVLGRIRSRAAIPLLVEEINGRGEPEASSAAVFVEDPFVVALRGIGEEAFRAFFEKSEFREARVIVTGWIGGFEKSERADLVPALVVALGDEKRTVRIAAAQALEGLGRDGEPAVAALTKALADEKRTVRVAAAKALGSLGSWAADAAPTLGAMAASMEEDWNVGLDALKQLGAQASGAVPNLLPLLDSYNLPVRLRGLYALRELRGASSGAVAKLVELLSKDSSVVVRAEIPYVLGDIGLGASGALPALLKAIDDPVTSVSAARALGKIGEPALPAIVDLLNSESRRHRVAGVTALHGMEEIPRAAIDPLMGRLDDDDSLVRERAQRALLLFANQGGPAEFAEFLEGESAAPDAARRTAVEVWHLARLESGTLEEQAESCAALVVLESKDAVPVLVSRIRGLSTIELPDRGHLFRAVVQLDRKAAAELLELPGDVSRGAQCIRALEGAATGESGLQLLVELLPHATGDLLFAVLEVLPSWKKEAAKAAPALVERFARTSLVPSYRYAFAVAIRQLTPQAFPLFRERLRLSGEDRQYHIAALAEELRSSGGLDELEKEAREFFETAREARSGRARAIGLGALGEMAKDDAERLAVYTAGLADSSKKTRAVAAERLGSMGKRAASTVGLLEKSLEDSKDSVRVAARQAIERIEKATDE